MFDLLEDPNTIPESFIDSGHESNSDLELERQIVSQIDGDITKKIENLKKSDYSVKPEMIPEPFVQPWELNTFLPNMAPAEVSNDNITCSMELEYMHGYRCTDSRNNLNYLANGEIIYFSGSVGIVQNTDTNVQKFFFGHSSDIISIAFHPDQILCATADKQEAPIILIWNSTTMATCWKIENLHRKGVTQMKFSPDGKRLATVGMDNDYTIGIYRLGEKMQSELIHTAKALHITFGIVWNKIGSAIFTYGPQYVCYWEGVRRDTGRPDRHSKFLVKQYTHFGTKGTPQTVTCACVYNNIIYTGTAGGNIYSWDVDDEIEHAFKCTGGPCIHDGPVFSITTDGVYLYTAGKDGLIQVLDTALSSVKTHKVPEICHNSLVDVPTITACKVKLSIALIVPLR